MIAICFLAALVLVNASTIAAFAIDKRRAIDGEWRISETTLLGLALFGGAAGACWARHRFRHKTRKQPFATQLDVIAMMQAGIALGLGAMFIPL